ncbi:MAG: hypothetical protein IJE22_08635 [Oscillibacter sp.]|nr:hypothetical protein [Oscillibacter sp.]
MRIGDTVSVKLSCSDSKRPVPGKVVYIHPQRRYYTVECLVGIRWKSPIRESSPYPHRRGED